MSKVSVYYNSACPVCNAGIGAQRRRMQSCDVDVEWIDIHRNPERLTAIGASREFDTDARNQSARGLGVQRICSWVVQVEQMARAVVERQALPSRGSIRFGRTAR